MKVYGCWTRARRNVVRGVFYQSAVVSLWGLDWISPSHFAIVAAVLFAEVAVVAHLWPLPGGTGFLYLGPAK